MINETSDYSKRLAVLEKGNKLHNALMHWRQGMLEHVISYRAMLDPTEKEMIAISDDFVRRYSNLMRETRMMNDMLTPHILTTALKEATDYRDFNETVVKKIVECKVQCAMFPQMADHSLREMNYFVKLLKQQLDLTNYSLQQAAEDMFSDNGEGNWGDKPQ